MLANHRAGDEATPLALSPDARARLLAHRWPGNLRELHNAVEYARSLCSQGVIELDDLPDHLAGAPSLQPLAVTSASTSTSTSDSVWASASALTTAAAPAGEAAQLLQHLAAARWNVTEAARRMGLSRMTLYRRMQRWGIASPNQRASGLDA